MTGLLLGFSVYASLQGEPYSEERSTPRELRSLDEIAKFTPPLPGQAQPSHKQHAIQLTLAQVHPVACQDDAQPPIACKVA